MLFVGIDLAERHSAAVAVDEHGTPIWESTFDAGPKEKPARPFVHMNAAIQWWSEILSNCLNHGDFDIVWAVEHVHHHAIDSTPVLRLQGGLLMLMAQSGVETHLVTAHEWQLFFGYSKKLHNNSKTWAKDHAGEETPCQAQDRPDRRSHDRGVDQVTSPLFDARFVTGRY